MPPARRHSPSPALVIACLALAVALSGTGYAAFKLPKASVGTVHLKKDAVTSAKVRNRTLLATDFALGQIPAGPPGAAGAKGEKGDKGDNGDKGATGDKGSPGATTVTFRQSTGVAAGPGFVSVATASCLPGETVVGGGATSSASGSARPVMTASWRNTPSTWYSAHRNEGTSGFVTAFTSVLCASP